MAFGEPRIDAVEDASGWLSSIRGRVRILAARLRMHLNDDDVAEMQGIFDDCDEVLAILSVMRAEYSMDYAARIGKRN